MNRLPARLIAIALVGGVGAAGVIAARSPMYGGVAWLAFLFFVLSGWGFLVLRAARLPDTDFGLRALYGTGGLLAIAGVLLAAEKCNSVAIWGLLAIGFAGFAWRELVTDDPMVEQARRLLKLARENPGWAAIAIILFVLAGYQMLSAVVRFGGNEWDDDIAYTSFTRRLLDLGEMNEPFSFRRLSAYGGQIILNACSAVRNPANIFLVEHGLFQGLSILVMLGAARARKLDPVWQALLVALILLLPDTSINTASYWTGVAGFIALYRAVVALDGADGREAVAYGVVAAILGGALCTLRQNYLPMVVLFLALFLVRRALSRGWRGELRLAIAIIAAAGATLLGYLISAQVSNHTFLFPIIPGTWNHGIQLTPVLWSTMQEIEFFVWCCVEPHGLIVVVPLFCVLLFSRDQRAGKPLTMFFLAACGSFAFLVHSFTSSDPLNLWRYAFGFAIALATMLVVELGPGKVRRVVRANWVAQWVLLASLLVQIYETRGDLRWKFRTLAVDVRAGLAMEKHPDKLSKKLEEHYARFQASVPRGAKVMTAVDAAGFLDFTRNQLAILDMPGWSAEAPGYPSFQGAEAKRAYLAGRGYRYLMFVRHDRSVALYRRDGWLQRLFTDLEVSRIMGAYLVDTIDSFDELATRCKVLYEEDGFVTLDLEACR